MSASSRGTSSVPSVVKQENDWEIVSYDTTEQDTASDPLDDPFNNVGSNSTCDGEISTSPVPVIKQENTEQENSLHESTEQENPLHENSEQENSRHENSEHIPHTISPYFMSEVTSDTAIEGEGSPNEESEAIEVAPDWSWEASNEGYDNDVNNEEPNIGKELDNSNRENVFIDVDYNGILSSDSDYKEDDDDDYDSDVSFGKRKKPKKSPQKNKSKKCKLTASDYTRQGSNKIEIFNNPEHIYIPDGWQRRVFQRLTGKYPGKLDVFYIEPSGRRFKSKIDIIRYYADNRIKLDIDVQKMCFGYGRPGSLPVLPDHLKKSNDDIIGKVPSKPKNDDIIGKVPSKPKSAFAKAQTDYTKAYNKRKCEIELSTQNSAVSALCDRLFVKDVTVEYSQEDFVNLTNHQVYTEYISALLESENPEASASAISEVAEAKWKQFEAIKESKSVATESKISQEVLDFLNEDNHEEPEDDCDEDYKVDGEDSNDSDYHTSSQKVKKRIQCPCCMEMCNSKDEFGKHLKIHEEDQAYDIDDNPYSCPHCDEKFESIDNLFCHIEKHGIFLNNKQPGSLYSCIYCVRICSTLMNLKQHVNSHLNCRDKDGNVVMYMCPICQNRFTKVAVLRKHVLTLHSGPSKNEGFYFQQRTSFDCPHCPMKCIRIQNLMSHIRSKHTEEGKDKSIPDKYKCIQCDYTTNRRERLAIHIRTHTGEKPFKCHLCDHATANVSNLKLHMLIHNETKRLKCSFCDYRCNQRSSLKVHERIHTDDRPYLCTDCGHRCLTKNNLEKHMKTHTEGYQYDCNDCGMKFLHPNSLKTHMTNVHSSEVNLSKQFQCPQCNYRAATKGNLKVHMRVHTGERSYQCPECGKKFTQGGSLKIHMRKHTGEKPFGCRKCGYRCTTRGNLLKHMIKHGGYTSKDIIEDNSENGDNEEYSESNCKKILDDIMKIGCNLEVDHPLVNEEQVEYEDVEIVNNTSNNEAPDMHKNFENIGNVNDEPISKNDKQINYVTGQANTFEAQPYDYGNLHQTILSANNEVIKSNEKRTSDEHHFLSQFF